METSAFAPVRRRALIPASALLIGSATLSTTRAASWTQTPASGMGDVAAGPDGRIWLTGGNGTIWHSDDGRNFARIGAGGTESVAVGPNGASWAAGANGTLWVYR